MTTCSALRPGSKIVDQNLENAPAGENEMPLLGPGGIFWVGGFASE